jgi:hypothetical protein
LRLPLSYPPVAAARVFLADILKNVLTTIEHLISSHRVFTQQGGPVFFRPLQQTPVREMVYERQPAKNHRRNGSACSRRRAWPGLTTRDIAREAKVTEGLIYHHFKDKVELVTEAGF